MEKARPAAGGGMMKDRRGFTLFELLIVIFTVGLLMGIAALSFNSMQTRYLEEQQVKTLYTDLMNARIRAMQHGRDHFVSLVTATSTTMYRVYEDSSPDGDGIFSAATDSLLLTQNVIKSHSLVTSVSTLTIVQFNEKGLLSTNTPTAWIKINPSAGGEYDCVVIDLIKTGMGKMNGAICTIK